MGQYHKYTTPPGDFEAVYSNEDGEQYDAWFQSDQRHFSTRLVHLLLGTHLFPSILDIGCGKGAMTHLWAIPGRKVVAYDIAKSAIYKAKAFYPDVDFRQGDVLEAATSGDYDLIVCSQVLYLQKNWRDLLEICAKNGKWILVNEWIPQPTHWYVPSIEELEAEIRKHFHVETKVVLNDLRLILLAKSNARI